MGVPEADTHDRVSDVSHTTNTWGQVSSQPR